MSARRKPARIAIAGLGLFAATVARPAIASDVGAGCGPQPPKTTYDISDTCRLVFQGWPLYVFGDATASHATVHVWITMDEVDASLGAQNPTVVECSASGDGYAKCDKGLPDETTKIYNTALEHFHLLCHVRSNGIGTYRCVSGAGF